MQRLRPRLQSARGPWVRGSDALLRQVRVFSPDSDRGRQAGVDHLRMWRVDSRECAAPLPGVQLVRHRRRHRAVFIRGHQVGLIRARGRRRRTGYGACSRRFDGGTRARVVRMASPSAMTNICEYTVTQSPPQPIHACRGPMLRQRDPFDSFTQSPTLPAFDA